MCLVHRVLYHPATCASNQLSVYQHSSRPKTEHVKCGMSLDGSDGSAHTRLIIREAGGILAHAGAFG